MISYNVKLITNDFAYLRAMLEETKSCYNFMSNIVFNSPNWKTLSVKQLHHMVYYPCREQFKLLPAQAIIRAYKLVLSNYKTVKKNKHNITKPLKIRNGSMRLDKRMYHNLTKYSIDLFSSTKNKRQTATFVLYPKVVECLSKYNVTDPLIFIKDNELFISLTFNVPTPLPDNNKVLGIDRGQRRLIATSDGLIIKGGEFQQHKRRIRYNKKQLQKKGTKSARRRLKQYQHKEANFSNNYCHEVANAVLQTDKGIIVLEDLNKIKDNTKKQKGSGHNRRFSQIPLFKLQQILTYKAQHLGKRLETVSPKNTSKNDCRGYEQGTRVGCRYYAVDGKQFDADINAAVNIGNRYHKHLALIYPKRITSVSRLLVNEPIACKPSEPKGDEVLQATESLVQW